MSASPLLTARSLCAGYGDFQALFSIDFEIGAGEVVALIGANGAGKSTLLKAFVGLVPASTYRRQPHIFLCRADSLWFRRVAGYSAA